MIDLNDMPIADGYEVTGRLCQADFLKSAGTCPFPYCDRLSPHAQTDHTISYPEGPTALGNLSCPDTGHHRVKTHSDWRLRQPFPGIYVWKDPFGDISVVDGRGTHRHADR